MLNAIEQVNKDEVIQNYYSHFFVNLLLKARGEVGEGGQCHIWAAT